MTICNYINVSDERLLNGLTPVVQMMSQVNASNEETIMIDLSRTRFITPLFAISLLVWLSKCKKEISLVGISDYLNIIGINKGGIKPDLMRKSEFLAAMEKYSSRTYIPIVDFPANSDLDEKEAVSSVVENIIIRQHNIQTNVAIGLKYMIEETLDNITEHSEAARGWLFAQTYPQKGYLDLCIGDNGITLLGSYKRLPDNELSTDLEAIKAANRGISSKNLPNAENRGYGIYTSKRMLVEGLEGQYLMISGGCLYVKSPKFDGFYSLPDNLRWDGTIISLRIPYANVNFNYVKYLE